MDRSKSHLGACQVDRGVLNVDFLWQVIDAEIHRSSKDWLLWGFIFAVGLALAVLGEWRRRKGVACHPAESAVKPAWSGYEVKRLGGRRMRFRAISSTSVVAWMVCSIRYRLTRFDLPNASKSS